MPQKPDRPENPPNEDPFYTLGFTEEQALVLDALTTYGSLRFTVSRATGVQKGQGEALLTLLEHELVELPPEVVQQVNERMRQLNKAIVESVARREAHTTDGPSSATHFDDEDEPPPVQELGT